MLTSLHTPEAIADHVINLISEEIGYDKEVIIELLFRQKNKYANKLFWMTLRDEYPNYPFKKLYYWDYCGVCEVK
jgi:hypothetical protein